MTGSSRPPGLPDEGALAEALGELAEVLPFIDASCLVGVLDGEQNAVFVNGRFCELSEYTREELAAGHKLFRQPGDANVVFAEILRTAASAGVWRGNLKLVTKTGRPYALAATIVPIERAPQSDRYLAICHQKREERPPKEVLAEAVHELAQVTEEQRERTERLHNAHTRLQRRHREVVEEQTRLVQEESLASLGLLASAVAHEINNPLAGVMACVAALRDGTAPAERRDEYFDTIQDALERIRDTVRSLLSYARRGTGQRAEADAAELIASCLTLLSPVTGKRNVTVNARLEPGEAMLWGVRSELMHASMNVLHNAAQAAPEGSTVEVFAERADNGDVILHIRDRGPGIPPELLERVCEPFVTTKPAGEGTGLGLALASQIVDDHGGQLTIDSQVGGGTTVSLRLPTAASVVSAP